VLTCSDRDQAILIFVDKTGLMGQSQKLMVKDIKDGQEVDDAFSVKYKKPLREYKNGWMFILGLSDISGEIEAVYWGGDNEAAVKRIYEQIEVGDVLQIKGTTSKFKGRTKIDIDEESGKLKLIEDYNLENFVERSEKDPEGSLRELKDKVNAINNQQIKQLLTAILEDEEVVEKLKQAPAAMYLHHAYIGGLLEHILSMINICQRVKQNYPQLDHDLLIAGCLLHDIGKIKEFEVSTHIKQSEEGLLRGHMSSGAELIIQKINELHEFPERLKNKLLHLIISHHGKKEYGSAKEPAFPEAACIYYVDELDSKLFQYLNKKKEAKTDDFHIWDKRLGQIYLK